MGFFSDLKQDLSQAVNELKADGDVRMDGDDMFELTDLPDAVMDSDDSDFDKSLDNDLADILDGLDESFEAAKAETLSAVSAPVEPVPVPVAQPAPEVVMTPPVAPAPAPVAPAPAPVQAAPVYAETPVYQEPAPSVDSTPVRPVNNEVSIIMESMIINGNMATEGSLEIRGSIVGNVEALGKLNITGKVQGNSSAAEIFADGAKINGDIRSTGTIKIGQTTTIIGNVYGSSAVVAGAVKGDIDIQGPVILDSTAIVLGNIKSKAVQINNGAVIEGMCSQCYAEVNPTSFFDELKKSK